MGNFTPTSSAPTPSKTSRYKTMSTMWRKVSTESLKMAKAPTTSCLKTVLLSQINLLLVLLLRMPAPARETWAGRTQNFHEKRSKNYSKFWNPQVNPEPQNSQSDFFFCLELSGRLLFSPFSLMRLAWWSWASGYQTNLSLCFWGKTTTRLIWCGQNSTVRQKLVARQFLYFRGSGNTPKISEKYPKETFLVFRGYFSGAFGVFTWGPEFGPCFLGIFCGNSGSGYLGSL